MDFITKDYFKDGIGFGADVKILQYENQARSFSDKVIDLNNLISENLLKNKLKKSRDNCIVINIEKDIDRYNSCISELKKVSFDGFVHLKATYWKERDNLIKDMKYVLEFLKTFNDSVNTDFSIDLFSETSNKDILIQDGPLACYCSHLRAMMYGYKNFSEYTIVAEDDIYFSNTENIEKYIKQVPNDWDIICFNSIPKFTPFDIKNAYKFETDFHSTHFYIIKNSSMKTLFEGLYPITEQVDVLISNMRDKLNIYNLPDTVYQKSVSTNTQNNLHVIFSSPNYKVIRDHLQKIKHLISHFFKLILDNNHCPREDKIVSNIMFDVIYQYITNFDNKQQSSKYSETYDECSVTDYDDTEEYTELFTSIAYVLQCCKKGIDIGITSKYMINNIFNLIVDFCYDNRVYLCGDEFNEYILSAYDFGGTCHTYISSDMEEQEILKIYNDKLRWVHEKHNDPDVIFEKECEIMARYTDSGIIRFDRIKKIIVSKYLGESLYDNFTLPTDWKDQLFIIFANLTACNINYKEFKLQNILVNNGKINFCDFGLAEIDYKCDNIDNYNIFVELLEFIDNKFKHVDDIETRKILYMTFINNIKTHKISKYLNNVF